MIIDNTSHKRVSFVHFDSIYALSEAAHDAWARRNEQTDRDYVGSLASAPSQFTIEEALTCAAEGGYWPEGAEKMRPVELDIPELSHRKLSIPKPEQCFYGYRPNVPAALAGNPVDMWTQQVHHVPNRILRIGVNIGKSWDVSGESTLNRGAAILSIVDALQASGFNVELTAVWRNRSQSRQGVNVDTVIKQSHQTWSADSFAFALANDAFQRRLVWAVVNRMANTGDKNAKHIAAHSMGNGMSEQGRDFDIYFPYVTRGMRTIEQALDKLLPIVSEQLTKLEQAAA